MCSHVRNAGVSTVLSCTLSRRVLLVAAAAAVPGELWFAVCYCVNGEYGEVVRKLV